jgi:hypothetical protein
MKHSATASHLLTLLLLVSGCAMSPDGASRPPSGAAGPVAWEIIDVGQLVSPDNQRMRWSYVIVLREAAGSAVLFERVERSSRTSIEMIGGTTESQAFARTLAAHGELRYATWDSWGWTRESGRAFGGAATIAPLTVEHRFIGRTSGGQPVGVTTRIQLDRSVGKVVTPTLSASGPLPPPKTLQGAELPGLVGRWRGSHRADGDVFDVPTEIVIRSDSSVEVALNDPITSRFRATASIRDGALAYAGTPETGTLRLYERDGQRVLAGYVSAPRQGSQAPVGYTIRVEWQGP